MIVIVLGLPGSGKSYFAGRLAEILRADYINSDRVRKELFPKSTYSDVEKAAVYDAMRKKMEDSIAQEMNVVLDATFHKKSTRALFKQKIQENIRFIEVWADEEVIKERMKRSRPYSEADYRIYQLIRKEWEPVEEDHLRLQSTNDNIDDMLERAMKYLKDDKRGNR